jgi:hypothetical protein
MQIKIKRRYGLNQKEFPEGTDATLLHIVRTYLEACPACHAVGIGVVLPVVKLSER